MKTREDKIYSFFGHLIMTILTLLAIIPILLMFISSLTDNATLLQNGYSFLPEKWSTYAYEWVFTSSSSMVIKAYGMSFILTATGVVCSLALTTCLAYGLSKKGLPGRNVLTFPGVLYHAVQRRPCTDLYQLHDRIPCERYVLRAAGSVSDDERIQRSPDEELLCHRCAG